jgi:hypothetical protein
VNYSWKIARLGLDDELNNDGVLLENSIVQIHYKRIATDDDGTTSSYVGTCYFSAKAKAAADFIALNDVTNVLALAWLEESLGEEQINKIDTALAGKVARKKVRLVKPGW